MLWVLIVQCTAALSDREVSEQVAYNLLYRALVGLGVNEAVPVEPGRGWLLVLREQR